MRLLGVVLAFALLACGPKKADDTGPKNGGADKDALCTSAMTATMDANEAAWNDILAKGEPKSLEDLAAAACQRFCGRATECAIQDACTELDGDGVAGLHLDKTAPENTAQCLTACNGAKLTKEQITTLGNCAQDQEASCATFQTCTAPAMPK
jgi:hypothetical protein